METNVPDLVVTIYQNEDFVTALIQDLYEAGMLQSEDIVEATTLEDAKSAATSGKGSLGAGGKAMGIFRADANLRAEHERESMGNRQDSGSSQRHFTFSSAHYLKMIRRELNQQGLVKFVDSIETARAIRGGDFVEFTATFRANQLTSILDIATPSFVSEVTRYTTRSAGQKILKKLTDLEKITVEWQKTELRATKDADFAYAATNAIKVDFRNEHTSEYWGSITSSEKAITAITICDNEHFVSQDRDRILDGEYKVLGKVSSEVAEDRPVLDRNKVLNRVGTDFLEQALSDMKKAGSETPKGTAYKSQILDLSIDARIAGYSFKVLPIAIYV